MRTARPLRQRESLVDLLAKMQAALEPPPPPPKPQRATPERLPPDPKLIPVSEWGRRLLGDRAPHSNTLLRWIAGGHIKPMPVKLGNRWYVRPDAEYIP